jgi:pimeloyl-ACP methyl ester carboxylesterase
VTPTGADPSPGTAQRALQAYVAACSLLLASCASPLPTTGEHRVAGAPIAYSLTGGGRPAVVLQSGLGDGRSPWSAAAPALARSHVLFAYDRPGYGDSAASPGARDPCSVAAELRSLLSAAHVEPPFVLVGHSLGGLYQYAFARLYPADVAGLVLLDATHPDHWRRMQADVPAMATVVGGLRATLFSAAMRREFDDQQHCIERLQEQPPLHVPVRVLVRTRFDLAERGAFETMVHALEADWLQLVGARALERVEGAGHYIQKDQPARVVAAVESVAAQGAGSIATKR